MSVQSSRQFPSIKSYQHSLNRPGFPGECFICELRLPDHRF
ncbi:taurine dioxygenase [Escherichia coli]|nr:taurine dioxygenase [Escherichia coli]KAA0626484.1 taurine dioxygenase [Escherichia coli]KAA0659833.1 taurine dioxygenase [Escherichia coli]